MAGWCCFARRGLQNTAFESPPFWKIRRPYLSTRPTTLTPSATQGIGARCSVDPCCTICVLSAKLICTGPLGNTRRAHSHAFCQKARKLGCFKCPAIDVAMPLQSVRGALESTTTASEWIPGMGSFQTKDPATGGFEHALQKVFDTSRWSRQHRPQQEPSHAFPALRCGLQWIDPLALTIFKGSYIMQVTPFRVRAQILKENALNIAKQSPPRFRRSCGGPAASPWKGRVGPRPCCRCPGPWGCARWTLGRGLASWHRTH